MSKQEYMENGELREGETLTFDGTGFKTAKAKRQRKSFFCWFGWHKWSYKLTGGAHSKDYLKYGIGTCDSCGKTDDSLVGKLF